MKKITLLAVGMLAFIGSAFGVNIPGKVVKTEGNVEIYDSGYKVTTLLSGQKIVEDPKGKRIIVGEDGSEHEDRVSRPMAMAG